jgi:glycyl-tRNA synthetase
VHRRHPELLRLSLIDGLAAAARRQPVEVPARVLTDTADFLAGRLEQLLTEEGRPVDRVRAVLPHADRPYLVDRLLAQLDELIGQERFRALAEAIQRARRIVPAGTPAGYDPAALVEPAEVRLHEVVKQVRTDLDRRPDLVDFTEATGPVVEPVNTFFDEVFVMAEEPDLRRARLGLLATVRDLGSGVLAWEHLRM